MMASQPCRGQVLSNLAMFICVGRIKKYVHNLQAIQLGAELILESFQHEMSHLRSKEISQTTCFAAI
jgi:hypothetical protein